MNKYWYEKRIWCCSPILWPVSWEGWILLPTIIWGTIVATGFWLIASVAPQSWHDALGFLLLTLALVATLALVIRKTDPGAGWFAGWEREKRLVPRFGWISSVVFLVGFFGGLHILMNLKSFPIWMLFAWFYQLVMASLLYKVVDPNDDQSKRQNQIVEV